MSFLRGWGMGAVAVVLALAARSGSAAVLVQSTFDTDADGWSLVDLQEPVTGNGPTIVGLGAVTFKTTGNPGGSIFSTDPSNNDFYFAAPEKFHGNFSAALGGSLSFDVSDTDLNLAQSNLPMAVLIGGGETLYFPAGAVVGANFSTVTLGFSVGSGWRVNSPSGSAATQADLQTVLSSLTGMAILGDWFNGNDDTTLDNVRIISGPEPASVGVLALGGLVMVRRRRMLR